MNKENKQIVSAWFKAQFFLFGVILFCLGAYNLQVDKLEYEWNYLFLFSGLYFMYLTFKKEQTK